MPGERTIKVTVVGDAKSAQRALASLDASVAKTDRNLQSVDDRLRAWSDKLSSIGATMTKAVTLPIAGLGVLAARELMEVERVNAQTAAAIKSTGGAANVTSKHVSDLAERMQNLTAVDAEEIQSAENLLLTFTKVRNEVGKNNDVFDQATMAALDMSAAMGTDLQSATLQVGKALNDPVKGTTALTRAGVQFTEQQKDQIETMVESGRTMDAQKVILRELETQFGGSAKAAGDTLGGQLRKAQFALEDMGTEILDVAMPAIRTFAEAGAGLARTIGNLPDPIKNVGVAVAGMAALAGPATFATGKLIQAWAALRVGAAGTAAAMSTLNTHLAASGTLGGAAALGVSKLGTAFAVTGLAIKTFNELSDDVNPVQENIDWIKAQDGADAFAKALDGVGKELGNLWEPLYSTGEYLNVDFIAGADAVTGALSKTGKRVHTFAGMTGDEIEDWRLGTVQNFNLVAGSLDELAGRANVSSGAILRTFRRQLSAMRDYEKNWDRLIARGLPQSLLKQLQDMGPSGAGVVEALADANDKQFDRIIKKWGLGEKISDRTSREFQDDWGPNGPAAKGLREGMKSMLEGTSAFVTGFQKGINVVREDVGLDPIKVAKLHNLGLASLYRGSKDFQGGMAWVGERGPEIMYVPKHAEVIPADQTHRVPREIRESLPGFAKGKGEWGQLLELLHPGNDPEHDDHLHAALSPLSAVLNMGRYLIQRGFRVAEHPAFPPFNPAAHSPTGYHNTNPPLAIDVNWGPSGESAAEKAKLIDLASWISAVTSGRAGAFPGGLALDPRQVVGDAIENLEVPLFPGKLRPVMPKEARSLIRALLGKTREWIGSAGGGGVGGWIQQAMKITGAPAFWGPLLHQTVDAESGGDPRAYNGILGASGIAQTIPSTFAAYSLPGMKDIWNPVHNLVASIRYRNSRYSGGDFHPYGPISPYLHGGISTKAQLGVVSEDNRKEAHIPLESMSGRRALARALADAGARGGINVEVNVYGDNYGYEDFEAAVVGAIHAAVNDVAPLGVYGGVPPWARPAHA